MSQHALRQLLERIFQSRFFAIMCYEYTDVGNKEQLSFCIRWVKYQLTIHEDFIAFYEVRDIKSDTIVNAIKDILMHLQLSLNDCRGQTYDGASNMLGRKSGVATQITNIQPKAIATHCHAHSLSLAVKDVTAKCKLLKEAMGTAGEMAILVKFSPKWETILGEIKGNIERQHEVSEEDLLKADSLSKLSTTRRTVRADCFRRIIDNYTSLYELWQSCLSQSLETDIKSRVIGCQSQMEKFEFYFALQLSHKLYALTDNLSKLFNHTKCQLYQGKEMLN